MKYFENKNYNSLEIVGLQGSYAWKELMQEPEKSMRFSYICSHDEKKYIEQLWNSFVPAVEDGSVDRCHYPYYALRLIQDNEVVAITGICWQCDSLSIVSKDFLNTMLTFDSTTDEAQRLFKLCRKISALEVKRAIKNRDDKLLNDLFYGMDETMEDYFEILLMLLNEEWHSFHRDILLELQQLKNPKAIEELYRFVATKREQDVTYHQAIWALADIGTKESKEKLALLSTSKHKEVASLAKKRLDEWENELSRKQLEVLPEGWYLTDEEDDAFTKELFTELVEGHPLFGKLSKVIAHQDRVQDDVLCKHIDEENLYSMVHLTWSQRGEFDSCPSFDMGFTWEEFVKWN